MGLSEVQLSRFHGKYTPEPNSGCWIWLNARDRKGYGHTYVNGKTVGAHRMSWFIHNGAIPDGMMVLHKCDNPSCVNPMHLFLGSGQDNVDDKVAKDRQAKGSDHGRSKLTELDVAWIKSVYPKIKGPALSKRFNVTKQAIYHIVKGRWWTHIKPLTFTWTE